MFLDFNTVRVESAEIFAELLEVGKHPENVGGNEVIGKTPPLTPKEVLLNRLKTNHTLARSALNEINKISFTDSTVLKNHEQLTNFYQKLYTFEDAVIYNLARVTNNESFADFIDTTFETGKEWPELLAEDKRLIILFSEMSQKYALEFDLETYEKIFTSKLAFLRTQIISEEFRSVKYEFTLPKSFSQGNISVNWIGTSIEKLTFSLQHPNGSVIKFKTSIVPGKKDGIITTPINRLPTDGTIVSIPNDQYSIYSSDTVFSIDSRINYEKEFIIFNFFQNDPILSPLDGTWILNITAPVGLKIYFGANILP